MSRQGGSCLFVVFSFVGLGSADRIHHSRIELQLGSDYFKGSKAIMLGEAIKARHRASKGRMLPKCALRLLTAILDT